MWISHGGQPAYLNLADRALQDSKIFNSFKMQTPWVRAVGMGDPHHAQQCYRKLMATPEVYSNLPKFQKNDFIGKPPSLNLASGRYGFDTLRFAETACYLSEKFEEFKTVVEYGSNYGGLCFCLLTQFPDIERYHCIDFATVQNLQDKYLRALGADVSKVSYSEPSGRFIFISEYALTEQTDWQEIAERYFPSADGLFIRCNLADAAEEKAFIDHCRRYFHVEIKPEPKTRGINKVVIGFK